MAAAAEAAARLNAATITKAEVTSLLAERQSLLDRIITPEESNRLEYVRWSLDRFEDATHGASLDQLESNVEGYEALLNELAKFSKQLEERIPKKR